MSGQGSLDLPREDGAGGKAPDAFRTIGEVADRFGIRQHVLRYWEEQFPMLRPLKRAGGRRYYRAEDVQLVGEIASLLYQRGYTIRGARQALEEGAKAEPKRGEPLARPVDSAPSAPSHDLAGRLRELRASLGQALLDD